MLLIDIKKQDINYTWDGHSFLYLTVYVATYTYFLLPRKKIGIY